MAKSGWWDSVNAFSMLATLTYPVLYQYDPFPAGLKRRASKRSSRIGSHATHPWNERLSDGARNASWTAPWIAVITAAL